MQEELKTVWNGQNSTCQTEVQRLCTALCALYVCSVVVTFVSLSIHVCGYRLCLEQCGFEVHQIVELITF